MKYYSDVTKKIYDTEEELTKAEDAVSEEEKKHELRRQERADAAKRVEDAYKKASDAYRDAGDELQKFVDKYGAYHTTITNFDDNDPFVRFLNEMFWF